MASNRDLKFPAPKPCRDGNVRDQALGDSWPGSVGHPPTNLVVVPLDHLQKHRGSVLNWFGEDLEQVAFFIKIHQDFQFLEKRNEATAPRPTEEQVRLSGSLTSLQSIWGAAPALGRPFPSLTHRQLVNVLLHFDFGSFEPLPQHLVVAGGHIHELHAPLLQVGDLQGREDTAGLSLGGFCARSISWDGQCQDTDAFPWYWPQT